MSDFVKPPSQKEINDFDYIFQQCRGSRRQSVGEGLNNFCRNRANLIPSIDGTLITRMMDANFSASHTPYSYPPNMVEGMAAAARVIADALLSNPSGDECELFDSTHQGMTSCDDALCEFIANRRALIEPEPNTPADRVCIVPNGSGWAVTLDGTNVYWFGNGTDRKGDAEIYRLGLIEQLKQEGAK